MKKEIKNKSLIICFEELSEEIYVQFYGIIGAILFFLFLYLFSEPSWMRPLVEFFLN